MLRVLFLFLFIAPLSASAATFSTSMVGGILMVTLAGEIENGDLASFASKVGSAPRAVVILKSGGGSVLAGIGIGEMIHQRGYSTVVLSDTMCASACGLIWISGAKRMIQSRARVGFHAAFIKDEGTVTSSGNALVGAYYGKLGLSDAAIIYLTEAAPRNIQWLTPEAASQLGIEVTSIPDSPPAIASRQPTGPVFADDGVSGRLVRAFNQRLRKAGVLGLNASVELCYAQVKESRDLDAAVYCAALDVLTAFYDQDQNKRFDMHVEGGRNSAAEIRANTDAIAKYVGVSGKELRDRASAIALRAQPAIEDPGANVAASAPTSGDYDQTPIQRRCSLEADALNLHGQPRLEYRQACKSR